MPAAHARALARYDLSEGRKVATKRVRVLVVNLLHVHLAEVALMIDVFFHRILFFMSESPYLSIPARDDSDLPLGDTPVSRPSLLKLRRAPSKRESRV